MVCRLLRDPWRRWFDVKTEQDVREKTQFTWRDSETSFFYLPAEIGYFQNLQRLEYKARELQPRIPTEIGQLTRLKALDLDCGLTHLPREIGQLSELELLNLGGNRLSCLPTEIGLMANLRELWLPCNQTLAQLPTEIGQLNRLTELYLNENRIRCIPTEFGQLAALVTLTLGRNPIEYLPTEIGRLKQLECLSLTRGKLRALPAEIGSCCNLRELFLCSNHISCLPPEVGRLSRLTHLDMGCNLLTCLPTEIGDLVRLREMNLSQNFIRTIPSEITQLSQLQSVELSFNRIRLPSPLSSFLFLTQSPRHLELSHSIFFYYHEVDSSTEKEQSVHQRFHPWKQPWKGWLERHCRGSEYPSLGQHAFHRKLQLEYKRFIFLSQCFLHLRHRGTEYSLTKLHPRKNRKVLLLQRRYLELPWYAQLGIACRIAA